MFQIWNIKLETKLKLEILTINVNLTNIQVGANKMPTDLEMPSTLMLGSIYVMMMIIVEKILSFLMSTMEQTV